MSSELKDALDRHLARFDAKVPKEEAQRIFREMTEIKRHQEAAASFCEGFSTAALEGRTLREVVKVCQKLVGSYEVDERGGHYMLHELAEAREQAAALLSHFKDKSDE